MILRRECIFCSSRDHKSKRCPTVQFKGCGQLGHVTLHCKRHNNHNNNKDGDGDGEEANSKIESDLDPKSESSYSSEGLLCKRVKTKYSDRSDGVAREERKCEVNNSRCFSSGARRTNKARIKVGSSGQTINQEGLKKIRGSGRLCPAIIPTGKRKRIEFSNNPPDRHAHESRRTPSSSSTKTILV